VVKNLKMASLIDTNSMIGTIIVSLTNNITGSLFLTLLFITMVFLGLAGAFKMPLELTIPFILPFFLVGYMVSGAFLPVLGVAIIYLSILLLKRMFL